MLLRTEELIAWADDAKMWKEKVQKAKQDLEQGRCTKAEYYRVLDASTAFSKNMIKALS